MFDYGSFTSRANAMRFTADGSGSSAARGWDAALGLQDVVAFLCPFRVGSLPSTFRTIAVWYDAATAVNAQVRLNNLGQLQLRAKFTQVGLSSAGLIDPNVTYWLGAKCKGDANGYVEAKVWSADGTLIETVGDQVADEDTRGDHDQLNIGFVESEAGWQSWFGEIWVDDADYPPLPTFEERFFGRSTVVDFDTGLVTVTTGPA
jgi:hypothetical protein